MSVFCTFDFEICFPPQRLALFEHLNFQRCSERGVFCACWLQNILCATTACAFSTSQLPKVLWTWSAFIFFTSKCASCHNCVQFFISHLPNGSAPAALASLLLDPPEPQIIRKTQWIATTFSRTCIFFPPTLSLLWSSFFFASLTLPTSAFPSVHTVGSLTSKTSFDYTPSFAVTSQWGHHHLFMTIYVLYFSS